MHWFVLFTLLVAVGASAKAALPVVPAPQQVRVLPGTIDLGKTISIAYSPAGDPQAKRSAMEMQSVIRACTGMTAPLKSQDRADFTIEVSMHGSGPHMGKDVGQSGGYKLSVLADGITVSSEDSAGLFYGTQTLKQLVTVYGRKLPKCEISDWPDMKHRAVMIDMARLMEKREYYYELIDQLAAWKINTIYLHFSDDGNCGLEYKSRPEITTPYAFTQEEMKKLIEFARERHVEVVPEVESWGHASYILNHEKYAGLRESKGTLCTLKQGTWEVLDDLYRETAALFPSRYLHIGCDEATFGKCPECKAFIEKNGKAALVGKHLTMACELAKKHGKVPILWGDVLLRNRECLEMLPKDAVIAHWNYKASVSPEPSEFLTSKGFTVIACPSLIWGGRMVLPHGDSLENTRNFGKIVRDQRLMGMSTTVWVPTRYITDALWYGLAYAAEISWSGSKSDESRFGISFFKLYYGLDTTPEFLHQAKMAHYLALGDSSLFTNLWNYAGQYGKLSKPGLLRYTVPHRDKTRASFATLKRFEPLVKRHKEEYQAFVLAAEASAYASERAASAGTLDKLLQRAKGGDTKALSDAISLTDDLIARHEDITRRLAVFWDRRRYPDHPLKYGGGQNLLGTYNSSCDLLKRINSRLKDIKSGKPADWDNLIK